MTLTLDAQLEQRLHRVQTNGNYRQPADVIEEALSLLEEELQEEDFDTRLKRSRAAADRGELYTPEQARQILAERRASRGR